MDASPAVQAANSAAGDVSTNNPVVGQIPVRVALLTNCIPPYVLPVLQRLAVFVKSLRVLLSTPMEPNRPWQPDWGGLDVFLQKSVTVTRHRQYKQGFAMTFQRHFPYDTLPLLHRYKPDVVVSAGLGFRTLQAIVYRRFCPSTRLVIWADLSEHTEREIGRARTMLRRLLLQNADAVLAIGSSGARYVERLSAPVSRVVCSPYGSEMPKSASAKPIRKPCTGRRLLYVGQLIERKGLHLFLPELARWAKAHPEQGCEMWFVGDGPLRESLEQFPAPSNLNLRFFGNVPYHEVAMFYSQAAILVLPTLWDTWGLVVNEAMAAGLPILGSRYSQAVEELVQDGTNGWTFHPDRPGQLWNALDRALTAPTPSLERMQESARSSVSHLTSDYVARRFLQAIRIGAEHR